eukprot:3683112-Rhodomonas_salina.2
MSASDVDGDAVVCRCWMPWESWMPSERTRGTERRVAARKRKRTKATRERVTRTRSQCWRWTELQRTPCACTHVRPPSIIGGAR